MGGGVEEWCADLRLLPGRTPIRMPAASAALTISSSRTCSAAHMTAHSTMSSLPSPRVFHTAFSSSVLPVIVTRVPPPVTALPSGVTDFEICPNCIRLGGMRSGAIASESVATCGAAWKVLPTASVCIVGHCPEGTLWVCF